MKQYEEPTIEVLKLVIEDVVTTSGGTVMPWDPLGVEVEPEYE